MAPMMSLTNFQPIVTSLVQPGGAAPAIISTAASLLASHTIKNLNVRGGGGRKMDIDPGVIPTAVDQKDFIDPIPSQSLAQDLHNQYWALPQSFRYVVAGTLGNVGFYILEKAMFAYLLENPTLVPQRFLNYRETISFSVAYLVQVVPQHFMNAVLCYGYETIDTRHKYKTTLIGMYSALGFTLALSTILNAVLIQVLECQKDFAFGFTLFVGAVLNYVLLTFFVNRTKPPIEIDLKTKLQ